MQVTCVSPSKSRGASERLHHTLKTMIRFCWLDTEKDWDDGVPLLVFAFRESVQESLGFSPFYLVFGHSVRDPLKLLKEKFLVPEPQFLNPLQYVTDMKQRLQKVRDLAKRNLKEAQNSMPKQYNKTAVKR